MTFSQKNLLLHSCCAPCLTSVYEQIEGDYLVTAFWFNPNIEPIAEHELREQNLKKYCQIRGINLLDPATDYPRTNQEFQALALGFELEPEGGERCAKCIYQRLEATAKYAKENGFEIFGTTLSVSPHKNAAMINRFGQELAVKYKILFLEKDFKKNDGYKRSVELSRQYGLYRQSYCGCKYSKP